MDEFRSPLTPQKPASMRGKAARDAAPRGSVVPPAGQRQVSTPARKRRGSAESLGADVARRIEQFIISGALHPGERLNEVALARSLGVSRGPVREAARALEKTGLVTVIMNRGAFVRSLDLDEAMEIYEINALLLGLASGRAAGSLTASQAFTLRGMVEAMDAAIARDDRADFFRINSNFHAFILASGRNREAQALYGQFTRKLLLLRRRSFERPGHMQEANREHRGLMEAILAGDGALARTLAEAHARLGRARFLDAIGHAAEAAKATKTKEDTP
jgi:DNA-binding GntR family transcriptional regulator